VDIMDNGSAGREAVFARALLSALAGDGGLQRIVDIGSAVLGNPIVVTDKSWKAIAITTDADVPGDGDWRQFRENGLLSPESVASGLRVNIADKIDQSAGPFRWQGVDMAFPRVFVKLATGDRTAATLSVVESGRRLTEEDEKLLVLLGDALSAELRKDRFQQYSRGLGYEDFIRALLEGRLTDPKAIEGRVKLLNLGLKKYIHVFVFDVGELDARRHSVAYMRDQLEQMLSGGRALVYEDRIVITASFSRALDIFRTELKSLAEFLRKYSIRCGISRRCTEPASLQLFYRQALDAMRVGTVMDPDRYIYPYGEYALYHVAQTCAEAGGIERYCHPGLEALLAYDLEYQTHFADSLYAYLRAFRNITTAAASLHLHRNTLVYHLKRIGEIMDISLDKHNTIQQVELSFRLLEYGKKIGRLEKWDEIPESDR
jgi:hypothetical protein